mmetsp:Transcript_38964/g.63426  ORF Transcript_38964/g.63426 Transcript_38964/m.63426 type:complete len:80 (-) Transcript_38964:58-297(-)
MKGSETAEGAAVIQDPVQDRGTGDGEGVIAATAATAGLQQGGGGRFVPSPIIRVSSLSAQQGKGGGACSSRIGAVLEIE